jgi:uncharacterized protein (DUF3084 family)
VRDRISQKEAQISQKEAQISQKEAQISKIMDQQYEKEKQLTSSVQSQGEGAFIDGGLRGTCCGS